MSQNANDILNKQYESLCSQLGDLEIKRLQIEEQIEHVRSKIKGLNDIYPQAVALEAQLKAALSEQQNGSN